MHSEQSSAWIHAMESEKGGEESIMLYDEEGIDGRWLWSLMHGDIAECV